MLGQPARKRRFVGGSGADDHFATWTYAKRGYTVSFLRRGTYRVSSITVTGGAERTATGVGIGSTRAEVKAGVTAVHCKRYDPTYATCFIGKSRIGDITTAFRLDRQQPREGDLAREDPLRLRISARARPAGASPRTRPRPRARPPRRRPGPRSPAWRSQASPGAQPGASRSTRLVAASASGPFSTIASASASATSSALARLGEPVDEAERRAALGVDRVAGERQLHRDVVRDPVPAGAAARRRPRRASA